jgi:hypothetical protein
MKDKSGGLTAAWPLESVRLQNEIVLLWARALDAHVQDLLMDGSLLVDLVEPLVG